MNARATAILTTLAALIASVAGCSAPVDGAEPATTSQAVSLGKADVDHLAPGQSLTLAVDRGTVYAIDVSSSFDLARIRVRGAGQELGLDEAVARAPAQPAGVVVDTIVVGPGDASLASIGGAPRAPTVGLQAAALCWQKWSIEYCTGTLEGGTCVTKVKQSGAVMVPCDFATKY